MRIDLNADVGESFGRWPLGDDDALLAVVTSANVACGFHAGDPLTLTGTCRVAVGHGVTIGAQVGYGSRWTAQRPSQIGVVAIGYGDGYPRTAHGDLAVVKVVDQLVPVIGRVSMDMLLVDLTDLTYAVPNGTSVCLWGESPSVDQIAESADTLGYELLCRMTQRPIRHHIA